MSKQENNTTTAQEAAQSTIRPLVSRETMEEHQRTGATYFGCDDKKAVSGKEYNRILIRALAREKIDLSNPDHIPAAISCADGMKANNSALRQWLYERSEKQEKAVVIPDKYRSMMD
jgi:hypothetical protein